MYLTLNKWLELFYTRNISYSTFLKKVKVKKNNNDIVNMKDYKKVSKKTMNLFYEIIVLNKKKYLSGILSDGDIRRNSKRSLKNIKVKDLMTKNPVTVEKTTLATKSLEIMQNKKITKLIVGTKLSKKRTRPQGIISIHHILQAGIK